MRHFAVIKKGKQRGRGRENFWNATNHLHCASRASAQVGGGIARPRGSGSRLPGQSFEFRNEMLERLEVLDCGH